MNRLALVLISGAGVAFGAGHDGSARGSLAPFQITVNRTTEGVDLQCTNGCAWKTATYICDGSLGHSGGKVTFGTPSGVNEQIMSFRVRDDRSSACRLEMNERNVGPGPTSAP